MSLINQMLQELDARGNQAALGGVLQGQVRAVPQRRNLNWVWMLAIVMASLLCAGGLWAWLGRTAPTSDSALAVSSPPPVMPVYSLKIDDVLGKKQATSDSGASAAAQAENAASLAVSAPPPSSRTSPVPALIPEAAPAVAAAPKKEAMPIAVPKSPPSPKSPASTGDSQQKNIQLNAEVAIAAAAATKEAPPSKPVGSAAPIPAVDAPVIAKQVKELTPRQLAENEYRKASGLIQHGRLTEAMSSLEQALQLDNRHPEARQTLAALLIQTRRQEEAMRVLRDGLQHDASQSGLAMILARLQLERNELKPAIETLQRSLADATDRADYVAFLAALMQRDGRHREAIEHYAQALRKAPGNAIWWMGQGISLQAENRIPEAIEAFKRAKAGNGLSAELRAFVEDRLNSL